MQTAHEWTKQGLHIRGPFGFSITIEYSKLAEGLEELRKLLTPDASVIYNADLAGTIALLDKLPTGLEDA